MAEGHAWTEDRIAQELSRTSFGHQIVHLPHGLSTEGRDRSATAATIFEERLDGKSVFDLGCRFGFFCFYAEERGAAKVVGAEVNPEYLQKARLLAEMKGAKSEFRLFDVESDTLDESFDHILCLNVLHHLRNPLSAIDKLLAATRERLIVEVAGFGRRDRRETGVWFWMVPMLSRLPVLLLARNSSQTYFMTTSVLQVLLLEKRADIARVDVRAARHSGRAILIAHRRRIKHLVVVAGLPAAGKSTFIEHVQSHKGRDIASRIGFDPSLEWNLVHFGRHREADEPEMGNVILHYNINGKHAGALPEFMSVAEKVTIVTLMCPPNRLVEQFKKGRAPKGRGLFTRKAVRKKLDKLLQLYESEVALDATFAKWFASLARWKREHVVVKHDGAVYSVEQVSGLDGA